MINIQAYELWFKQILYEIDSIRYYTVCEDSNYTLHAKNLHENNNTWWCDFRSQ